MPVDLKAYRQIFEELSSKKISLVAVSKTKPIEDILQLYREGQFLFGENYVQEIITKQSKLPPDIQWHFIGHLQTNKVKQIAPFIDTIQSVDSLRLLQEINKQAAHCGRTIKIMLQVHIATEETKFGLDENELITLLNDEQIQTFVFVQITGLMGMATNTQDINLVRKEFMNLKNLFDRAKQTYFSDNPFFHQLSMGMSGDYSIAIECGSTMVRVGSLLFGSRN